MTANHDGGLVATVGDDDVIRIWDGRTGRLRSRSLGATQPARAIYIDDETLLAVDYRDGGLLIQGTPDIVDEQYVDPGKLAALAYSADGAQLWVTNSRMATLLRREPGRGSADAEGLVSIAPAFFAPHTSPFGGPFVVGEMGVFDAASGTIRHAIKPDAPPGFVRCSISPDGKLAAIMSYSEVVVITTATGEERLRFKSANDAGMARAVLLSSATNTAAIASARQALFLRSRYRAHRERNEHRRTGARALQRPRQRAPVRVGAGSRPAHRLRFSRGDKALRGQEPQLIDDA